MVEEARSEIQRHGTINIFWVGEVCKTLDRLSQICSNTTLHFLHSSNETQFALEMHISWYGYCV